jgi:glycosyltransferase involved in cell wall biosynthesis
LPDHALRQTLREFQFLRYPSTFEETSCLSVIEAMAAGCRVICPSFGALAETTGRLARLYQSPADPAEHGKFFGDILIDEFRNPWGGNLDLAIEQRIFARENYDWPVRIREWRELIETVCRGRRTSSKC